MSNTNLLNILSRRAPSLVNHVQRRNMPVNVPATATGKRRFRLAVETDPNKLVNYCCGLNYHIDEAPIKLKPDNEYPEWLWKLRLTEKPNSWELEKGTKEYYQRLKEEENQANYLKRASSRREKKVVSKVILKQQEYLRHIRFAALAHMEEDAGIGNDIIDAELNKMRYLDKPKSRDFYLPMNENRVVYMDKIKGNSDKKNYYLDRESTFKMEHPIERRQPIATPAILDSKRRHRYSTN